MLYIHKSNDVIQDVIVECLCPIIEDLADEFDMLRRCESLAIYAPSPIAREILGRILEEFEDVWVVAESHNELLYKDDNKVIITLSDDGAIFVENAYDEDGVIKRTEAVLSYVYDGFTNKEVEDIAVDVFSVLVFGFEEDEIENTDVATKEETKSTDTSTTAVYKVNGKEVDKDTYEKALANFNKKYDEIGEKYLDNVRDMLLGYYEWMDAVADLHSMFRW